MHFAWLITAVVSGGSSPAVPLAPGPVLFAQADETPPADKPHKKRKKKKADDEPADGDAAKAKDGDATDKGALISDIDSGKDSKSDAEPGSKSNPLQLAEGAEKVIQVKDLASAEAYDELAAEVTVKGDELHVKALSAGRTNVQATLKDGTFKTWVLEVLPTKGK